MSGPSILSSIDSEVLMKLCSDSGISLTFLSPNGRFISRVQGATRGNVLLRKAQYALSDDVLAILLPAV